MGAKRILKNIVVNIWLEVVAVASVSASLSSLTPVKVFNEIYFMHVSCMNYVILVEVKV